MCYDFNTMDSVIVGTKAARRNSHIDVNRMPCQFNRLSRLRAKDIKKDKSVYSVYCRICHLEKKTGIHLYNQKAKQAHFELNGPGSCGHNSNPDSFRCRCDENSLNILRKLEDETPKTPNRTLPARLMQYRFMNEVGSNFRINETVQMPLSTLIIRWKIGRNIPSYDTDELLRLLSYNGNVDTIYKQTPNSAIIILNDITSACRIIQTKHLGEPRNKIHCVWYHKCMSNKLFYSTSCGLKVRSNPYIHMYINNNNNIKRRSTP